MSTIVSEGGSDKRTLALLFALYFAQAIPSSFFGTALPVVMRKSGASLGSISLVYVLLLPWGLKFLWAPYVDRYGSRRLGHYTSWIVPMQLASIATVAWIASIDPIRDIGMLFILGAAFSLFAATQDIGADALAVRMLPAGKRATGSSTIMIGGLAGSFLGSGALLMLYERIGWFEAVWLVGAAMFVPLLFLLAIREPSNPNIDPATRPGMRSLIAFLKRPGMVTWLLVISFFGFGGLLIQTMTRPLFVDLGLDTATIGTLLGVVDPIATTCGLLLAPLLVRAMPTHATAFVIAGLANASTLALYVPLAMRALPAHASWGIVALESFTTGMMGAMLYVLTLDRCTMRTAGTDFTAQNALFTLGRAIPRVVSGGLAARLGYVAHFAAGSLLYVAGVAWAGRALRRARVTARRSEAPGSAPPSSATPR